MTSKFSFSLLFRKKQKNNYLMLSIIHFAGRYGAILEPAKKYKIK